MGAHQVDGLRCRRTALERQCFLIISDKAAIVDDTIHLYYCGQDHTYPGFAGDMLHPASRAYAKTVVGAKRVSRMGLATLPLDRFTCLETADRETPGSALTEPIAVIDPQHTRLILNVSEAIPSRDWVDVEILDAQTGRVLEGYARANCSPVDGDGLR